jgi:hypothetical protein
MPIYVPGKLTLQKEYIGIDDPDAQAYITAVEATDQVASPGVAPLELGVKIAIHSFVKGCKADGIWPAIKASCILAGARTLQGCLVPLVGAAPTNFNFVAGDYNRRTGLLGNGSTKYLNSNRNNNVDPQNSRHLSVFVSSSPTRDTNRGLIGVGAADNGASSITTAINPSRLVFRSSSVTALESAGPETAPTFVGASRAGSDSFTYRFNATSVSGFSSSQTPLNQNIVVFGRNAVPQADARLAFYSIGESLDLALLDARVTALINAISAAIP